jgi:DNA-binding CsgD family transcriptional regulator
MERHFVDATAEWDLDVLYVDLASAKGKHLTPVEKIHLQGLLSGHSPLEIAEKLGKAVNGVESDLSATIYRYVKSLLDKPDEKIGNWRNISEWLKDAGYKSPSQLKIQDLETDKTTIQITNINFEKNEIVFMMNLRVPTKHQIVDE